MLYFMPVSPLRTEEGALAALVDALGEDQAKPVELDDPSAALTNFRVVSDTLSVSAAGNLGYGTFFKGSASASEQAFYFDGMTFTDKYAEQTVGDHGIVGTRWGVGLRVLLRVTDIQIDVSLNFGLVGAAVELGKAHARYEVHGIGVGQEGLIAVLKELPALGDFSYETYLKLNGAVVKRLAKLLEEKGETLVPQPVAVALARPIDRLSSARAVYVAMSGIADRRPLQEVLVRADPRLDRDTLRSVYAEVAKIDDVATQPSNEAEDAAEEWLRR